MTRVEQSEATAGDNPKRVFLKDKAYDILKHRILDESLAPGSFLSERALAESLDMSITPVHSALERLELEGFVTISPQQGVVVRELSFRAIVEHFDLRVALESFVVRRLAGRLTTEQILLLNNLLDKQATKLIQPGTPGAASVNADFHRLLCELLDNREVLRVVVRQQDMLYRVVNRIYKKFPERKQQSHAEHTALAAAILAGDGAAAARLVEEHIEVGKRLLISSGRD